ncbi:hypothetical protein ABIF33_002788 [Bradyrhizobium elkanii]
MSKKTANLRAEVKKGARFKLWLHELCDLHPLQ